MKSSLGSRVQSGSSRRVLKDMEVSSTIHTNHSFLRQHNAMMFNYFKMNIFKAALTPELRGVVAQKDHDTMKIKKMYHVTTTAQ